MQSEFPLYGTLTPLRLIRQTLGTPIYFVIYHIITWEQLYSTGHLTLISSILEYLVFVKHASYSNLADDKINGQYRTL